MRRHQAGIAAPRHRQSSSPADPQLAIEIPFADAEHACRLAAMTVRGAQYRLDVRLLERVERGQVLEACLAARRRFQRRAHGRGQMFG